MKNRKYLANIISKVLFLISFVSLGLILLGMIAIAIIDNITKNDNFLINLCLYSVAVLFCSGLVTIIVNWDAILEEVKGFLEC